MQNKLKEYFCIYLDILGYSSKINNALGNKNKLERMLTDFINNIDEEINNIKTFCKIFPFDIRIFSDNILIAIPVSNETITDFNLVLKHIINYQKNLIEANYFIRGGITKGLLYSKGNTIWGPALIEAVKLEKCTQYPFIGISNDILQLFRENDLLNEENESLSVPVIEIIKGKFF